MTAIPANVVVVAPSRAPWWVRLGLLLAMDSDRAADTLVTMDHGEADDIRRSIDGDGQAYRRIIQRHQQALAERMRRFCRDPAVIEELVHETFVQAYFSLNRYRGDAPLIHWLHRIAVRTGYRYWKAKRRSESTQTLGDLPIAARAARTGEDREMIDVYLDKLPPRDRLVVTLLYLEDRSVQETSRLTGWSAAMVKVQAFRARGKLRKIMKEAGYERD